MLAVLGAKHELSQQIFTKTMTIQVWKPDNERAGRHFVYTGRYVLFFAELLLRTNDRDSMDMLARRIRRKAGDFANHTAIWIEYSTKYLEVGLFIRIGSSTSTDMFLVTAQVHTCSQKL